MIDLKNVLNNEKQIEFLETIIEDLSLNSQSEVFLKYKDFCFLLEPHGEKVEIFSNGQTLGVYKNVNDLFLNFLIDEKPFIERIAELEYDD